MSPKRGGSRRNDILKLVGAGRVETIWKTLEAALAGQGPLALEHLDTLLAAGEEPVGLLGRDERQSAQTASRRPSSRGPAQYRRSLPARRDALIRRRKDPKATCATSVRAAWTSFRECSSAPIST